MTHDAQPTPGPDAPVQARSRRAQEEILSAALACLLEHGYAETTTLRVQERAGVSRGKLLHHFPSKRDLLAKAVGALTEARMAELPTNLSSAPSEDDPIARTRWAIERLWIGMFQPGVWAAIELWTAARTDSELAAEVRDQERLLGAQARRVVSDVFGPRLSEEPGFSGLSALLLTSMRGKAMTYMFSDRDPKTEPMLGVWADAAFRLFGLDPAEAADPPPSAEADEDSTET